MSLKDNNTKPAIDFEERTCEHGLADEFHNLLAPLKAFYELINGYVYESSPETQNICLTLKPLLDHLEMGLEKVDEVICRTVGKIELECPCHGESVRFGGKTFSFGEYIRAVVEPVKLQAAAQGGAL